MNRKISLVNVPALIGTVLLVAVCVVAYLFSGIYADSNQFLVQVLNTVIGVVLVFCVFDIWYLLGSGISVKDGFIETGKGPSGAADGFPLKELSDIRLVLPDGSAADEAKRLYRRVNVEFLLHDNRRKTYEAHMLTRRQYLRIRTLLDKKSDKK